MDKKENEKVFNDPIHGSIELHPLLVKIIDTPQFQRLRNIKQLGGAYFVYPGASHNRFEHSIGTAHLAGKLVRSLKENDCKLNIEDKDVLCVEIAALCHDLGHGPFSHLYDDMFLPIVRENIQRKMGNEKKIPWRHEERSWEMFKYLVKENKLDEEIKKHGLEVTWDGEDLSGDDMTFIKEMMDPKKCEQAELKDSEKEKSFLYEIVSNKKTGLMWTSLTIWPDCYHLGIRNFFDHNRFLRSARVCKVGEELHICVRDKMEDSVDDLFQMRYHIHKRVCFHKVNFIIQHMIAEAFSKAADHIKVKGSRGKLFTLSTAITDMEAFTKLTDGVFQEILYPPPNLTAVKDHIKKRVSEEKLISNMEAFDELIEKEFKEILIPMFGETSSSADLKTAQEILNRILSRKFYSYLGDINHEGEGPVEKVDKVQVLKDIGEYIKKASKGEFKNNIEDAITAMDNEVKVLKDIGEYIKKASKGEFKNNIEDAITAMDNEVKFKVLKDIGEYIKKASEEELKKNNEDAITAMDNEVKVLKDIGEYIKKASKGEFKKNIEDAITGLVSATDNEVKKLENAIKEAIKEGLATAGEKKLAKDDFVVEIITLNYGMQAEDPVKHMFFYTKDDLENAKEMDSKKASRIRTTCFSERTIRVYYKKNEEYINAKKNYEEYLKKLSCDGGAAA